MTHYDILNHCTGETIFSGRFAAMRDCLEQAVQDGVALDYADLTGANLVNAMLDGASLRHARFSGANLMGANLSECRLDGTDFTNAGLQNACLCLSSLQDCNFTGCAFGATDITGCDISGSRFSTLSAFTLNFIDAAALAGCRFENCAFSRPPVVISGLAFPVILLDAHIKIGGLLTDTAEFLAYTNDNNPPQRLADSALHVFIHRHAALLKALISGPGAKNLDINCVGCVSCG